MTEENRTFRAGTPDFLDKPHVTLNYGVSADGIWTPMLAQASTSSNGSGSDTPTPTPAPTGPFNFPTSTFAPQQIFVGTQPTSLFVPNGANAATVHVVTGSVRRSIGGAPSAATPGLSAGDSETLRGAELIAYQLVREGNSDAMLHIEYSKVGA